MLVSGEKTIELRGSATSRVGETIGVALCGSKTIIGEVCIAECFLVASRNEHGVLQDVAGQSLEGLMNEHKVTELDKISYKKVYAWRVENPKLYEKPEPYHHPPGAQIWINLAAKPKRKPKRRAKALRKPAQSRE